MTKTARLGVLRNAFPLLAFGLLAFALRLLPGERIIDDAYITYRYAQNILSGHGFVYNVGERVLGTTTPIYTLVLAGLAGLFGTRDFPIISITLNALTDGVGCIVLGLLTIRLTHRRWLGWASALLWALAPMSVTFAIGGMETSLFIVLMLATMATNLWGYLSWSAFLAALSILTRPDALLFVLPLAIDVLIRHFKERRIHTLWQPLLAAVLPLAVWILFATAYFGSPLTNSVSAKSVAYILPHTQAVVRLWQHYSTPFLEHRIFEQLPNGIGYFWPLPGLLLYLSLHLIGSIRIARRNSRALAICVFPLLYFAAFSIANPLIFRWYLAPPLPIYFVTILTAIDQIGSDLSTLLSAYIRPIFTHRVVAIIPLVFFTLSFVSAWELKPDHGPTRPAPEMAWHELELLYTRVTSNLTESLPADSVVAAGDIGAVGYFSGANVLDTLGLISTQAVAYYPLPAEQVVTNYAISADLIADLQPDYLIMLEVYGRRTVLQDERFIKQYTLIEELPTEIYGSEGMLVFERSAD